MTEETIIGHLARWIDNRKYPYQIPRAFIYGWECDFWCMTDDGETREFEIKISRSDYAADRKKEKHSNTDRGANYFYYVCPTGIIAKEDVSQNYGLIHISETGIAQVIKKPRRLHDKKFGDWKMLAKKMYWKWFTIWFDKYKASEITIDEYRAGFNMQLDEIENHQTPLSNG